MTFKIVHSYTLGKFSSFKNLAFGDRLQLQLSIQTYNHLSLHAMV